MLFGLVLIERFRIRNAKILINSHDKVFFRVNSKRVFLSCSRTLPQNLQYEGFLRACE